MGTRELGGSRGAAAAAGAGEPVGAEAGVGLGTGGVKGTSLLLCSWLRWRPETLAELQVLDSGLSFVGTPKKKGGENVRNMLCQTIVFQSADTIFWCTASLMN